MESIGAEMAMYGAIVLLLHRHGVTNIQIGNYNNFFQHMMDSVKLFQLFITANIEPWLNEQNLFYVDKHFYILIWQIKSNSWTTNNIELFIYMFWNQLELEEEIWNLLANIEKGSIHKYGKLKHWGRKHFVFGIFWWKLIIQLI